MDQDNQRSDKCPAQNAETDEAFNKLRTFAKDHPNHDWLRTLYTEAWGQYKHEDTVSQSRNQFFITIQTALVAFVAAISGHLIRDKEGGLSVLGGIMIGVGLFLLFLTILWLLVNNAGQRYLNLRWGVAKAVEKAICLNDAGLAGTEHRWQDQTHEWLPYGKNVTKPIQPRLWIGGWKATRYVAVCMLLLWSVTILGGLCLLVGESYMPQSDDVAHAIVALIFRIAVVAAGFGLAVLGYRLFAKTKQFGGKGESGKYSCWLVPALFFAFGAAFIALAIFGCFARS